jgi:adenylate kinase
VIELDVPDDVAVFRLARRLRGDDDAQTACVRLETYRRETGPMIEYFAAAGLVTTVDGTRSPEAVAMALSQLIDTQTRRTRSWT